MESYLFILGVEIDVDEVMQDYLFKMKELEIEELEKMPSAIEDIGRLGKVNSI